MGAWWNRDHLISIFLGAGYVANAIDLDPCFYFRFYAALMSLPVFQLTQDLLVEVCGAQSLTVVFSRTSDRVINGTVGVVKSGARRYAPDGRCRALYGGPRRAMC